jgi:hypothetical protein
MKVYTKTCCSTSRLTVHVRSPPPAPPPTPTHPPHPPHTHHHHPHTPGMPPAGADAGVQQPPAQDVCVEAHPLCRNTHEAGGTHLLQVCVCGGGVCVCWGEGGGHAISEGVCGWGGGGVRGWGNCADDGLGDRHSFLTSLCCCCCWLQAPSIISAGRRRDIGLVPSTSGPAGPRPCRHTSHTCDEWGAVVSAGRGFVQAAA